ncbi:cache domain-containing sensor histidine kinase [Paenibacillus sp. FSL R7-0331]|uniref:cache domain-containing sensor histidine kinase n=1 Tax=Paenibacillus sp. FSL R7-0331 TaxID=1536773 RepID=UPI0004F5AA87|nr:sensor histidine kinase [Paenibacillus sp. FSL R7-0331]AIQ52120.1 histidine kinase [Paenibacillus sp. FSL R7-0331]
MKKRLRFTNLSIRYKLFTTYLLVIAIPFLLLLFIHLNLTQQENKEAAVHSSRKMLDETKSYLEYKSQAINEVLNFIAFNPLLQTSVSADSRQFEDVNHWHMEALRLSRLVNQFRYNEDIISIQVYMKDGLAGATENSDFLNMRNYMRTPWLLRFAAANAAFTWVPSTEIDADSGSAELSILRKIPNANNIREFDGIVRARVQGDAMQSVLDHAILTPGTSALLFNEQGQIISRADSGRSLDYPVLEIGELLSAGEETGYYDENYSFNGQRHILGLQHIPNTSMTVALFVPYKDILESSIKARNRIISIFLLVIPLMLPLSFFVSASATRRIRQLILHVRKVKNGKFQLAPLPASEDEIGELTRNFNMMVNNMTGLIEETYSLGREVKNKELNALQAQINPHFLYNTLDLINVMAIESGSREIKRVVDELAVFYKLSLSNGKEYVTLESELQHIEAYVRIQNMRFGNGIVLELEVPRDLFDCELPKIVLQPLVENAILHGIMEKEDEAGKIRVTAAADKGDVIIELIDDGIGMDASALATIFLEKSGGVSKGGGYGVRNIEERLKLSYGISYGITFASTPGIGTRVSMRVPDRRTGTSSA